MPTANPPLSSPSRAIHIPRLEDLSPERVLVLANALTLWRGIAALGILIMGIAGAPWIAMFALAVPMWVTDVLDGAVARRGWKRGAQPRIDGKALDPMMDDVAFVCGFLVLFGAGAVPLWFVAGLLVSRVLFALLRMLSLAYDESFARPLFATKFNGVFLALGQLLLFAHLGLPETVIGNDAFATAAIAAMTATTAYSVTRFAIHRHGRLLARLLSA
jgi:phosphatidylglycerophosphate synthase